MNKEDLLKEIISVLEAMRSAQITDINEFKRRLYNLEEGIRHRGLEKRNDRLKRCLDWLEIDEDERDDWSLDDIDHFCEWTNDDGERGACIKIGGDSAFLWMYQIAADVCNDGLNHNARLETQVEYCPKCGYAVGGDFEMEFEPEEE